MRFARADFRFWAESAYKRFRPWLVPRLESRHAIDFGQNNYLALIDHTDSKINKHIFSEQAPLDNRIRTDRCVQKPIMVVSSLAFKYTSDGLANSIG